MAPDRSPVVVRAIVAALVAAITLFGLVLGGRQLRWLTRETKGFHTASELDWFKSGLITLQTSPHAAFLEQARAKIGRSQVLLQVGTEPCRAPSDRLVTPEAYAVAYAVLPATVTCDPKQASFAIYFDRAAPAGAGEVVTSDDGAHVLVRIPH